MISEDVEELEKKGLVQVFPMRKDTYVWHTGFRASGVKETLTEALIAYEAKYPYRYGMKKAEIQMTYFQKIKPNVFDRIVDRLVEAGTVKRVDEFLCTPLYEVRKDAVYEKVSGLLLGKFADARYDFVRYSEIDLKGEAKDTADDILNILMTERQVVKVTEDMYTLAKYHAGSKSYDKAILQEDPLITIAQVRDIFETSRKSAKPILEYMDSIKVTKKTGAESERVHTHQFETVRSVCTGCRK